MKKIPLLFFILIMFSISVQAQEYLYKRALGLFMSVGVGPRIPVGTAAVDQNLGSGFDVSFSYADNEVLPFFIYTTIGYQHFPGKQSYYEDTDYSSFSNNMINFDLGARYYFSALVEDIVLLMPVVDAGASFGLMEKFHQFKIGTGRNSFHEVSSYLGFHVGAGFSMFMLDVISYYHYFQNNQYISFDFKVRIPIFVRL